MADKKIFKTNGNKPQDDLGSINSVYVHVFFIFSHILTEYVGIEPRVSVCLCVGVSQCECV